MTENHFMIEEGTIVKDEKGHRYRFHEGLFWGLCHVEPFELEDESLIDEEYLEKLRRESNYEL